MEDRSPLFVTTDSGLRLMLHWLMLNTGGYFRN
jgi:hypothetical protein